MNVVIPHASFEVFGGAELVVSKLTEYLSAHGHKVSILTYKCPPDIYLNFEGAQITTGSYNKLKEYMHDHYREYDIVNSHNHPMELLLWPKKRPHIWSYNEAPYYVQQGDQINPVEKDIVEQSVSIAVVANKKNEAMYKEIFDTPTVTNMYGIDVPFYSTRPSDDSISNTMAKYGLDSTKNFIISVVAWVHLHKRQREALKAFIAIKKSIPEAKLVLAGTKEPTETAFLEQIARDNKVDKDVIFTGHVDRNEVRDIYYASRVILAPYQRQGSYLTILESLCTKQPVVISTDTMLSEDLAENKVGIVTNDYTTAVMDLYRGDIKPDYNTWYEWASRFTWDRYCKNMEVIYNSLVSR